MPAGLRHILLLSLWAASLPLGEVCAQSSDAGGLREAAQQRGQRAESFLRPLDANRNGMIEATEVDAQAKHFLDRTAGRYGLQISVPMSIDRFRDSLVEAYLRTHSGGSGSGGGSSAGSPAGNGSALAQNRSGVAGFGSSTTSASSASGGGSSAVDERYRSYAANMLKRYDKNGSGALEREEWSQMRGEWWKSADTNGDGTIALDEIVGRLAGYRARYQSRSSTTTVTSTQSTPSSSTSFGSTSSPAASSSATTSSVSSTSATTNTNTATTPAATSTAATTTAVPVRKPYRFLTPTERLPAGLPDWFTRRDTNGDGQVTLAEFSEALSDDVASEFAKHDLNNDGVVTPQECLTAARGR